ncbi:MAG TPA: ATP-binding protein [Lentimicrobium sp.]|nr:ATP-binding protein [Lentimicrobium sp.]
MSNIPLDYESEVSKSLRESSLALGVEAMDAGAWSWIPGDGFINWNDKCFELFDQPRGPVSFDTWMSKVHPEDKQNVSEGWQQLLSSPRKFVVEFRIIVQESVRWIRIAGYVVNETDDLPRHITGIMLDVTAEKQFSEKLREANNTKDRFFSIIAHDLRSPFTSILGFSRLLNEEYDDFNDDERKMMIRQILNSTETTFQLLDNLLTWAKTQLGRTAFTPEYFEIEPLVLETINLALPQAKIKGISLKVLTIEKTKVYADLNMIRTVIRNLLSNSIKFSYEGATVTIEAHIQKKAVIICITDTGTGIEPKMLSALFSLNEEIRSTKGTANEKGTGLGLILCKEFIEKNGGKISVQSQVGEGSKFCFTIPTGQ